MADRQTLYIIDAMAMAFRSFYALGRVGLTTAAGDPVGAIYATALFLNKLIREQKPDYLVAVTDTPTPTFRSDLYPDYKATRDKMPDDLAQQLPGFWQLLDALAIPVLRQPGFEADDLIGSLVSQHQGALDIFIVSGDKDFLQLLAPGVFLFAPKKNQPALITSAADFQDKYGFAPEKFIDCLALMGDSADNVPGVKGIGEKGATKLIATYGSLDGVYQNLADFTGKKLHEQLATQRQQAFLSQKLVTIKRDLTVPSDLADLVCDPEILGAQPLQQLYERYEFKTLINQQLTPGTAKSQSTKPQAPPNQPAAKPATAALLRSLAASRDPLAVIFSATTVDLVVGEITAVTIATGPTSSVFVDLADAELRAAWQTLVGHPECCLLGFAMKAAWRQAQNSGLAIAAKLQDVAVLDYLIDPGNNLRDYEALATKYQVTAGREPLPLTNPCQILVLWQKMAPWISKLAIEKVWQLEVAVTPVLAAMEAQGIFVDANVLQDFSAELNDEARKVQAEIYELAGHEFNIHSPKQLRQVLYEELKIHDQLGIKSIKKTKTGLSTDEEVLSRLSQHPIAAKILAYREIAKLKSTYVDTLPQHIHQRTGRIHSSFNQTVAATGRLSSDQPNLQNIPMRTALGQRIRQAFRPQQAGGIFIAADYSQVEVRLLAAFANASHLIQSFKDGLDIHTATAAKIFGKPESEVTTDLRGRAKAVNFGIMYGMGPTRLARETGVSVSEAKDFIGRYFETFPEIKNYLENLKEAARRTGYSTTILGRKRPIPGLNDANQQAVARAENIAVNAPIQGSAADIIKLAMVNLAGELRSSGSGFRILLQIHDELVLEGPEAEAATVIPIIRTHMEQAITLAVPLKVAIHTGKDWLTAH